MTCRVSAVACMTLAALLLPGVVAAHAFLVQSSPQAGQYLRASPRRLVLQFTESVASGGSGHLDVTSATRQPVSVGDLTLSHGDTILAAALPRLANGVYIVHWQVVSADDGHPSAGEFAFAVGTGVSLPALSGSSTPPPDWPDAIASWLFLLGLAIGAGGLASEVFIWRRLPETQNGKVPAAPIAGGLLMALVGVGGLFVLFARSLNGGSTVAALNPGTWHAALQTRAGLLPLAVFAFVLYALIVSPVTRMRGPALLALIFAAVLAALRTHPATTRTWWGTTAVVIHLALAVLWTGVLTSLVLLLWRQRAKLSRDAMLEAVQRYARLALWSVLLVLLTGLGAALAEFNNVGQVVTTTYGRVLLVKIGLVALALLLALLARLRGLGKDTTTAFPLLRRFTRPEAITAVAVLGAAALLGNVPPPYIAPRPSAAASALLGAPPPAGQALHLAGQAGWLEVYLTASAGQLTLRILSPGDESPDDFRLHLWAQRPKATSSIDLFPRSCGPGCYSMRVKWPLGTTYLHMQVGTKRWSGGALTFAVSWPPLPLNPQLLTRVIATMRVQPIVALSERVTSGPGASSQHAFRLPGRSFTASEPYTARVTDVRSLPTSHGLTQLVLYLPGSNIWGHLWIDARHRLHREVIVTPGHLIERTFSYPVR